MGMDLEKATAWLRERPECSDVHLVVGEPVTLRVNGELTRVDGDPLTRDDLEAVAGAVLMPSERARLDRGAPVWTTVEGDPPLMVSVFRERGDCLGVALRRMLDADIDLEKVAPLDAERLRGLARITHGLVICSGSLGCGKTTTAGALLREVDRQRSARTFVVDTSPSYAWKSERGLLSQLMVGRDVDTIGRGIQTALQSDLDVLLLTELTPEAVPTALAAADTGHLVIAVMNARSAVHAVEKLYDAAVDTERLARALKAIVCQQLLPRHDRPGRVAAYEVLVATPPIVNLIREGWPESVLSVFESMEPVGQTMATARQRLAEAGLIAPEG